KARSGGEHARHPRTRCREEAGGHCARRVRRARDERDSFALTLGGGARRSGPMTSPKNVPVIVSGARTPIGRFLGGLSPLAAPDLGAAAIRAAIARAQVDQAQIDEVIMGNVVQAGVGKAPARQDMIRAGQPATVPAYTINK